MIAPAAYAFPLRALRRWSAERLSLAHEADGGVQAQFNFDGSTCGNVPFRLIYSVQLASASAQHRVRMLACAPAPHDDGHRRMCSFLETGEALLAAMPVECPLLGEPLAAALAWRPSTTPAGCVCAAPARAHLWLAVLHTLHFALAERGALQTAIR